MVRMALVGSVILTVAAIVASYPAISFLLIYNSNNTDTGSLYVGVGFAVIAIILWISAGYGWFKATKK